MKTVEERMIEAIKRGELSAPDRDQKFRDMIDECYSFKLVGGIFATMQPSRVLEEMDPIAFRCGVNDYEDSDDSLEEFEGDYYDKDKLDELRDECQQEYDAEVAEEEAAAADDKADQLADDIADRKRGE